MRHPRGQAAAEAALGILVVVTVLAFAIHFAEIGYVTLKVQESATSALWDSTQGKTHVMPGPSSPLGTFDVDPAIADAQNDAQLRYVDFEGRSSITRAGTVFNAFTQATGLQVSCRNDAPAFNLLGTLFIGGVLRDDGGAACTASAEVNAFNFPDRFQDVGNGFFKVKNRKFASPFKVCAVGRAWGSSCEGRFSLMLDDWGFSHDSETDICAMVPNPLLAAPCLPNLQYWWSVNALYLESQLLAMVPTGAAGTMAKEIVGQSPLGSTMVTSEDAFWMSFTPGSVGHFQPNWPFPHDSAPIIGWPTTPGALTPVAPGYMAAAGARSPCFLGNACD